MSNKFTFKKHPKEVGLAAVCSDGEITDIKHKKLVVGQIIPPARFFGRVNWTARLCVQNEETWKSVLFKQKFESESDARDWLNSRIDLILEKYNLYYHQNK